MHKAGAINTTLHIANPNHANMANKAQIDWDTGEVEDHVSIGPHKLYIAAGGQDRKRGQPVVLIMQGMSSTIGEWVVFKRLIAPFARWVNYDRSGLGRSEGPDEAPDTIKAETVAAELDILLRNAGVAPPYLVVCHSWGGYTAREFLHRRPGDVAGMVFVDCNNERSWDDGQWGPEVMGPLMAGQDWAQTVGLARDRVLSDAEWEAMVAIQDTPRHHATSAAEDKGSKTDRLRLVDKRQLETQALGSRPVSVISATGPEDFQKMYDAGVAAGKGTEDERASCRKCIASMRDNYRDWQRANLKLSSTNRFVEVDVGHNVQILQPQTIADEVSWALENMASS